MWSRNPLPWCSFVVYTTEAENEFRGVHHRSWKWFSWCTPWKEILDFVVYYTTGPGNEFRGVHHRSWKWISWCAPPKLKMIFVVYTMEGGFRFCGVLHHRIRKWILWTPPKLKMNFVMYTMEGELHLMLYYTTWKWFSWCTPQKLYTTKFIFWSGGVIHHEV